MITVFYYHVGRGVDYSRDFDNVKDAKLFYQKMKRVPYYVVSYTCNTESEMMYMEGISR